VESDAAWEALRAFGCTYAQGYFISKPIPVAELEELMANGPWATNPLDAPRHEEIASLERAIASA
jgi:predicted signal transduction protein with EAL and GGDEF domain